MEIIKRIVKESEEQDWVWEELVIGEGFSSEVILSRQIGEPEKTITLMIPNNDVEIDDFQQVIDLANNLKTLIGSQEFTSWKKEFEKVES